MGSRLMGFSQYRVWSSIAGVILTICITLCPHAVHSAIGVDMHDESPVDVAMAEESAHHDHGHCELDAAHSHEFLLPSSSPVDSLLQCARVVVYIDHRPKTPGKSPCVESALSRGSFPRALSSIQLLV